METQIEPGQNQHLTTKKERRQLRREERRREQEKTLKAKNKKNVFVWAVIIILVAAGGFGIYKYLFSSEGGSVDFDVTNSCVNHTGGGMHIHPELRIVINGERQDIPANTGISAGCMRPIHTHDDSGRLHVEFQRPRNFTLGEFFKVWDKPFPSEVRMTVNGEDNADYENLILKDGDKIEIIYGEK